MMSREASDFIGQFRKFARDEEAYGRLYADIHDLTEVSAKFAELMNSSSKQSLSPEQLEEILIELDIDIDHARFHLVSLKQGVKQMLNQFADGAGQASQTRGAA